MSLTINTAKKHIQNLLLISGSGRNSGKTSLACAIIKKMSSRSAIYALKISPHFHKLNENQKLLFQDTGFKIFREEDTGSNKDSSRMLKAGATDALYIQCEDKYVLPALNKVLPFIPENAPVICESGTLAKYYKPGLHLLIDNITKEDYKESFIDNKQLADHIITFNGTNFSLDLHQITFDGAVWSFKRNDRHI